MGGRTDVGRMIMGMIVVGRVVASVEAWSSANAHGLLARQLLVVVVVLLLLLLLLLMLLMLLLLASYCILNRRNVAVAALVVSTKGHGAKGLSGRAADAAGAKGKEKLPRLRIEG